MTTDDVDAPTSEDGLLIAGTTLDARYLIGRRLGRGGMGEVYAAEDLRLGRQVAVKVIRSEVGRSKESRKRFEREARATAKIVDDHVVTIFDLGVGPEQHPYLVMEYLEGRTLRALLDEEGALAAPRAARILRDMCLGVEAAHREGVIHRDLKPENLLLMRRHDGSESCKVLDFGLAKLPTIDTSDAATREGLPLGTLHYMSPEQARGDSDVDERTDVYGCAAVAYEMLTGERPHSATSHHALLYKIVHETPRRIEELCPYLPRELADAIGSGLRNDRRLRPATVEAFRCAIEPFAGATRRAPQNAAHTLTSNTADALAINDQEAERGEPRARRFPIVKAMVLFASGAALGGVVMAALASGLRSPEAVAGIGANKAVSSSAATGRPLALPPATATAPAKPSVVPDASTTSPLRPPQSSASSSAKKRQAARESSLGKPSAISANSGSFERINPYD